MLYSLRRVLPAELNTVYVKQFSEEPSTESGELFTKFGSKADGCQVNEVKGGFKITEYLNYNCLVSDATIAITSEYSGAMQRHWKCSNCMKDFVFNLKERMEHEVVCQLNCK